MGGGRQWFALDAYDPELLRRDPQQTAAVYAAMGAAAAPAAAVLNGFLDAELARHNLSGSRLALVGFSQGTMMALQEIGRAACREKCVSTCRSRWSPCH